MVFNVIPILQTSYNVVRFIMPLLSRILLVFSWQFCWPLFLLSFLLWLYLICPILTVEDHSLIISLWSISVVSSPMHKHSVFPIYICKPHWSYFPFSFQVFFVTRVFYFVVWKCLQAHSSINLICQPVCLRQPIEWLYDF